MEEVNSSDQKNKNKETDEKGKRRDFGNRNPVLFTRNHLDLTD